jgi:osmotically-inducible protein OsmY
MMRILTKSDSQIQQDVLRELKWDTRVEETDVGVEVDRGVVTLTGSVTSYGKRVAAQQAAHRVVGVLDVVNDIQIVVPGSGQRTDTEIAHAVRAALEWDADVPDERIQTTVSSGWVTLDGSVDFWSQRQDAERAVTRLISVRGVTNRIIVKPPSVDIQPIREAIEEALERRAEREARELRIEVHGGKVILSGRVHSWRERRAVVGAAAHAPGMREIEDRLLVDPQS